MTLILLMFTIFTQMFAYNPVQDSISVPAEEYWFWNQRDLPRKAQTRTESQNVLLEDFRLYQHQETPVSNKTNRKISGIYQPFKDIEIDFSKPFALEFLILDHVNQPVGFELLLTHGNRVSMTLEVFGKEILLGKKDTEEWGYEIHGSKPWKGYWKHIVLSYTGETFEIFHQGMKLTEVDGKIDNPVQQLYLKSLLDAEPYMLLHDLVKQMAIYEHAFDAGVAFKRFEQIKQQIESGKLYPDKFHLMAGPYLNHIEENSAQLVWETDQPSEAKISFGEKVPLDRSQTLKTDSSTIRKILLEKLKPSTTYYYQLEWKSNRGELLQSPVLTFQTAKPKGDPFMFGIISDTESRPQINHRVGEMLWDERPDFLIHLGDLTDGGDRDKKFQWTMEYFQGIGPLNSRIPVATVPGNGDEDLFWYNQYHPQTGNQGFYRFDYGDASFWMLNSNLKNDLQKGGEQYNWLCEEMEKSEAEWKFVVLHHAPYSADEDDYGNTWAGQGNQGDPELKDLIKLMENSGVKMVFFGHLHSYMRSLPLKNRKVDLKNGITYVQAGGTGGNLEDNAPTRTWFTSKIFRGFHYCTVQIAGQTIEFRAYDLGGKLLDFYRIGD
ncbi:MULTISPECIES: metallophosphoesterase family protein [Rhodonellum]|nr:MULTISPECIES: metallophosphoesterase [Rhodonellum]SDZ48029.1 3',5'-cyclic AMP phosphodiesterase CpdA [Rhodonellum ikkaensis]